MSNGANTTSRLKHDIDSGRSGDKVNFMDPAAAPLGTDDEAAGTPPTSEQVRLARQQEVLSRPDDPSLDRDHRTSAARRSSGNLPLYLTLGFGLLIGLAIWLVA